MVVDKIIRVLANSSYIDHAMEGSLSNASSSSDEPNDDMILSHFQNKAKMEALARRDPSKNITTPKKGENLPTLKPSFLLHLFLFLFLYESYES